MSRIKFRDLHGIVLLDKPIGLSSNQALQQARRLFRAAKGGHTGSLDPAASGMLPLCFGEATKVAGVLLGASKRYRAEVQLGVTTTTADREGEVLERRAVPALDSEMVQAVLARQLGRIMQRPPIYSALKQGGEPLYRKVRRGEQVEVAEREVEIFRIELLQLQGDRLQLEVDCGSGTYIRSIAVDLGEALGCGAHLLALRRLWVDPFAAAPMLSFEQLTEANAAGDEVLLQHLLPIQAGLCGWPEIALDAEQSLGLRQGRSLQLVGQASTGLGLAVDPDQVPIALVQINAEGVLSSVRGLNLRPASEAETPV